MKRTYKREVKEALKQVRAVKPAAKAEAIYEHPEGEFCYAEFEIKNIKYNVEC